MHSKHNNLTKLLCMPEGWVTGIRQLFKLNDKSSLTHIAMGAFHTVITTAAGTVYTYGLNDCMQLGYPTTGKGLPVPASPLIGPWGKSIRVKTVACGVDHTLLLDQEGRVFAWGKNRK